MWSPSSTTFHLSKTSPNAPLFPSSLLPPSTQSLLPKNYILRPLQRSDYSRGMLDVLRVLTTVGDISEEKWGERFDWMAGRNSLGTAGSASSEKDAEYCVVVVVDMGKGGGGGGKVVGTGAVIVERKFIHNLGLVGHIEDIAVAKDQQGKKLGLRIIEALGAVAENVGCYKTILDCSESNEGFYVKCGYKRTGLEMARYIEGGPKGGAGS